MVLQSTPDRSAVRGRPTGVSPGDSGCKAVGDVGTTATDCALLTLCRVALAATDGGIHSLARARVPVVSPGNVAPATTDRTPVVVDLVRLGSARRPVIEPATRDSGLGHARDDRVGRVAGKDVRASTGVADGL